MPVAVGHINFGYLLKKNTSTENRESGKKGQNKKTTKLKPQLIS
jgi:hypothetical protein